MLQMLKNIGLAGKDAVNGGLGILAWGGENLKTLIGGVFIAALVT